MLSRIPQSHTVKKGKVARISSPILHKVGWELVDIDGIVSGDIVELEVLGVGEVVGVGKVLLPGYLSIEVKFFPLEKKNQHHQRYARCAFWTRSRNAEIKGDLINKKMFMDMNNWSDQKFNYKDLSKEE